MMHKNKNLFAATLLMSCISGAMASDTATLVVTGTVEPPACKLNFEGGGVLDFGLLYPDGGQLMKNTSLGIECSAPMQVLLSTTDNNPNEVALSQGSSAFFVYYKEKFVGDYAVNVQSAVADSNQVNLLEIDNGVNMGITDSLMSGQSVTFADDSSKIIYISRASLDIFIALQLYPVSLSGLTEKAVFEGSFAVELTYL